MEESCMVDRRQRAAKIEANDLSFLSTIRTLLLQNVLQRPPIDEFHPEAYNAFETIGPENRDDVGVSDLSEETPFVDHRRSSRRVDRMGIAQQLERHFALQTRVPSPEHGPKGTASYLSANMQRTPGRPDSARRVYFARGRVGTQIKLGAGLSGRCDDVNPRTAMDLLDARKDTQSLNNVALV